MTIKEKKKEGMSILVLIAKFSRILALGFDSCGMDWLVGELGTCTWVPQVSPHGRNLDTRLSSRGEPSNRQYLHIEISYQSVQDIKQAERTLLADRTECSMHVQDVVYLFEG